MDFAKQLSAGKHSLCQQHTRRLAGAIDTESNWSTNSNAGGNDEMLRFDYPMRSMTEQSEDLDHHRGFEYEADHFTWTHKCGQRNCTWQLLPEVPFKQHVQVPDLHLFMQGSQLLVAEHTMSSLVLFIANASASTSTP